MKTLIATALVLSAGLAQAGSFDHEKQIGTPNLFATLATEGAATINIDANHNFDYQVAVGTPDLFPTLDSAGNPSVSGRRTVFQYQIDTGMDKFDPSLS